MMIANLILQTILLSYASSSRSVIAFTTSLNDIGNANRISSPTSSTSSLSMLFGGRGNKGERENSNEHEVRNVEYDISIPPPQSSERQSRLKRESLNKAQYVEGNELIRMRQRILDYENELNASLEEGRNDVEVENMRSKITLMRSRDAEYVYGQALEMAKYAKNMGNYDEESKHTEEAKSARLCIPHFNIEGLWVGK